MAHRNKDRIGKHATLNVDLPRTGFKAGEPVVVYQTWRGTFSVIEPGGVSRVEGSTVYFNPGRSRSYRRVPSAWLTFEE